MTSRDLDHLPRSARLRERAARFRRAVLRRRRGLAVLCVTAAVVAGLRVAAPPPDPTVAVDLAIRDLPAGATLSAADLTVADLPQDAVPDGVLADPVGAVLAAPLRAGEPVTDVRVVGSALATASPGTAVMPVRFSDAGQVGLLTPGAVVDVLATDPQAGTTVVVATDALVAAVPAIPGDSGDALSGRLVVLRIPESSVADLTGAAVRSFVTYAWASR